MRGSGKMDAQAMRAHNAQRVLRAVRKLGTVSRAELARATRLSPPTVSALVERLLKAGLLEERGEGVSNGGRKPQLLGSTPGAEWSSAQTSAPAPSNSPLRT